MDVCRLTGLQISFVITLEKKRYPSNLGLWMIDNIETRAPFWAELGVTRIDVGWGMATEVT